MGYFYFMAKLKIKNKYGIAPNKLINNEKVSLRAKGLYVFLQSKPDNWSFSVARIASQTKEGKAAIQEAIKELEAIKLLSRKARKDKLGKWIGFDYTLYGDPFTDYPLTAYPSAVSPSTAYPLTENHVTLSKKDISKKDTSKKDISKKELVIRKSKISDQINKVFDIFLKGINPTINFGHKTNRKAAENLIKKMGLEKTIRTVEYAISIQGERYAPVITTPYQLCSKLGDLMVYYKKDNQNNIVIAK